MPTLFVLFGLIFRIFTRDHEPPHVHVLSQEGSGIRRMDKDSHKITICKVWFSDGRIWGQTDDGRSLWQSLLYYKRLFQASDQERQDYQLTSFGIHWPQLDEDVSFESFEYPDPEPVGISRIFLLHPEINASAIARRLGMKQSLLASYINGTKHPSPQREQEIINELKRIGESLQNLSLHKHS